MKELGNFQAGLKGIWLPIAAASAAIASVAAAVPEPDPIPTESTPAIGAGLTGGERKNLSGAACAPQGTCLLIGDEKTYARFFTLANGTINPQAGRVHLLPGDDDVETDAEGIAFADGHFYIVGSHSRSKSGAVDANRHYLYRVPFDPQASLSSDLGSEAEISESVKRVTLDRVIAANELLRQHEPAPPGETREGRFAHGTNIEGIAVNDGMVYVGFRGPVRDGGAIILRFPLSSLLPNGPSSAESLRVELGGGQGVRDLAAVDGGLLILAGPETRNAAPNPQLFFWRPGSTPVRLGGLQSRAGGDSPEAIVLLEETAEAYRVLVLADGEAGDLPMIVRVPKQPPLD